MAIANVSYQPIPDPATHRHVPSCMKPTRHFRWRQLPIEPGRQFERSVLDQLWVDDLRTHGEWRQVPRVAEDAGVMVAGADLPEFL